MIDWLTVLTLVQINRISVPKIVIISLFLSLNLSFCLFDLIFYVPSTIFQLNRDGSSWVEPVLS